MEGENIVMPTIIQEVVAILDRSGSMNGKEEANERCADSTFCEFSL